jgi:transcriptional regulator with XRE-family HTH domain
MATGAMGAAVAVEMPQGIPVPGLREARRRALLTQEQLAARAGVNVYTVSNAERGQPAAIPTIQKLAAALAVEPHALTEPPAAG